MRRRTVLLISPLLACLLCLFGCSPNNYRDHWQTYEARLANVLNTEPPANISISETNLGSRYPDKSELAYPIEAQTISLRTFYHLNQCPAKSLIAERNTALGRTQLPSQRYLYEFSLILALEQCVGNASEQNTDIADWLALKRQQLPWVWSNMITTSQEVELALSIANTPLGLDDSALIPQTVRIWTFLLESANNLNREVLETNLEANLEAMSKTAMPAKIWQAQAELNIYLAALTPWLTENMQAFGCKKPQSQYLANVFQRYFVEYIQPVGNLINKFNYQFEPIFQRLQANEHLPPAFKHFVQIKHQLEFDQYQQQMHEHIGLWQLYFKECRLKPGG